MLINNMAGFILQSIDLYCMTTNNLTSYSWLWLKCGLNEIHHFNLLAFTFEFSVLNCVNLLYFKQVWINTPMKKGEKWCMTSCRILLKLDNVQWSNHVIFSPAVKEKLAAMNNNVHFICWSCMDTQEILFLCFFFVVSSLVLNISTLTTTVIYVCSLVISEL